ncbi:MAG: guanylate kinase [Oscillibacter sp.]|nr:guanylate kinase [Oscillibacter sp.]
MGRIFCIVGKSASGKDTLYRAILDGPPPCPDPVLPCTTRPMRDGERDGVDYRFVTEARLRELEAAGCVVEKREYHTVQGLWIYFTPAFPLEADRDRLLIITPEGVRGIAARYGADRVRTILLDVDDRTRIHRCVEREDAQSRPDYEELCRRFLADQRDFAEERVADLPNLRRMDSSRPLADCLAEWAEIVREG